MGADLERLAFAIFASDFHSPEDLEEAPRIWREMKAVEPYEAARFRTQARAFLTELLNPSEGMKDAGRAVMIHGGEVNAWMAGDIFTAVVASILADGGE